MQVLQCMMEACNVFEDGGQGKRTVLHFISRSCADRFERREKTRPPRPLLLLLLLLRPGMK